MAFIAFVVIIQFSGGVYLAAASDMVGTTALMQEDILMAGYASLIGLAVNFAVMFRINSGSATARSCSLRVLCLSLPIWCAHIPRQFRFLC